MIGIEAIAPPGPTGVEVEELCALAFSSAGIDDGHVAIEFVDEDRIRDLNREHRQRDTPTDVLSFPIDGVTQVLMVTAVVLILIRQFSTLRDNHSLVEQLRGAQAQLVDAARAALSEGRNDEAVMLQAISNHLHGRAGITPARQAELL